MLFYPTGHGAKVSYASGGGPMDMVFLLSAPVAAWAAFCLLLSSNGKVPKSAGETPDPKSMDIVFLLSALVGGVGRLLLVTFQQWKGTKDCRGAHGVLFPITTLCNRANLPPLLSGQKWQNPPGETPGPPLRRTRMGLVAPHAPDRVWRLRVAPPGKEPSANAAKSMEKQPVWRHLSPAGIPSGYPPREAVLGDRLGAAGLQPAIESAAPGGKEAPTTRRGGQMAILC